MVEQFCGTQIARSAIEIGGDDVPPGAPFGEMIERGHAPRERKRMLECNGSGDAKSKMFRHRRHGGHKLQRVVHRHLRGRAVSLVAIAAMHVVKPDDIGDEQPVNQPALQSLRHVGPVIQVGITMRRIARDAPHA